MNTHCSYHPVSARLAEATLVHLCYVLSAVPPSVSETYKVQHTERYLKSYKAMLANGQHADEDQEGPPYLIKLVTPMLLNSLARTSPGKNTVSYTFKENQSTKMKPNLANVKVTKETLRSLAGIGVDQSAFPPSSHASSPMLRCVLSRSAIFPSCVVCSVLGRQGSRVQAPWHLAQRHRCSNVGYWGSSEQGWCSRGDVAWRGKGCSSGEGNSYDSSVFE